MNGKRQNIQLELALEERNNGEAEKPASQGIETSMTERETESLAEEWIMEEVCERENLKRALAQVKRNKGSAGVDGTTVHQLKDYLKVNWLEIKSQLLAGKYEPQPVKRVEIPKPGGRGVRKLGIPNVLDRFIQQALMQVLQPIFEPTFSESSYGFRPKRSAHQAVRRAQTLIAEGHKWVVDLDLEQFFDRANHDLLMERVSRKVQDKRVLKLIRKFLTAGVMEQGLVKATREGTSQGSPLSPLLSNILLTDLDQELERRGHHHVRYADDANVYVKSERAGYRVKASITQFLARRLKLKVNEEKSAVARPSQRKFLGFSFMGTVKIKRRIAPQALERCKQRVRELTRRSQGRSLGMVVERLSLYLKGWIGYFGFCETPSVLQRLEGWIHRRLRSLVWKQWKRGRCRYHELRKREIAPKLAALTAGSTHGPWRIAKSPALHMALSKEFFIALGV
jgi:RNA-directed DNA polymerase